MDKILDIYSDYLIAQNQYATAVGLSDLLEGRISHDKITRFLNGNELTSRDLWEYIRPELQHTFSNVKVYCIVFIVRGCSSFDLDVPFDFNVGHLSQGVKLFSLLCFDCAKETPISCSNSSEVPVSDPSDAFVFMLSF